MHGLLVIYLSDQIRSAWFSDFMQMLKSIRADASSQARIKLPGARHKEVGLTTAHQ
jgi:hypothetical protein